MTQHSEDTNADAIQRGVNAADTGSETAGHDTVNIAAGTFIGEVDIENPLTLSGAQAGMDPNPTAPATNAQTILQPDAADANPFDSGSVIVLYVGVSHVTIDGVTVDGNNPNLPTNGNTVVEHGLNVDAAEGIVSYAGVGNITVENNIVENTAYTGLDFYNYFNGGAATSDNVITDNLIQHLSDAYGFGVGINLYNNFYAEVTDNVITDRERRRSDGQLHPGEPRPADVRMRRPFPIIRLPPAASASFTT